MCSSSQRKSALGLSVEIPSFGTQAKSQSHCNSVRGSSLGASALAPFWFGLPGITETSI